MNELSIRYFALLRDQRGAGHELLSTTAATPAALYAELAARYGFTLGVERLRVAVNGDFASWQTPLKRGDEVVFIPPVAGG